MIQKLMVEVNAARPINQYGEGHILVFDSSKGTYYMETRESFLQPQNESEQIEYTNKVFCLNLRRSAERNENNEIFGITEIYNEIFNIFKKDMIDKFNEFLTQYKETNAKMIALIKETKGE